jgi:hypothetical protein
MVPRTRKPDGRRRLSLAALLALVLHAIFLPLLVWLLFAPLVIPRNQPPERVSVSTAARMEKTNRPEPPNIQKPVVQQVAQPKPVPSSAPPKRELAKQAPNAPSQPPKTSAHPSFGQQLAQQEAQFAKTAQRLHAENNPLSVATPYRDPSLTQRSYVNAMGQNHQETFYAILTPIKHWIDGNMSCYYTTYDMRTSEGGEDDGNIPWPICYPKNHDAMLPLNRPHDLPVPYPPPGFTVAAGTYLTPFIRSIYEGHPAAP